MDTVRSQRTVEFTERLVLDIVGTFSAHAAHIGDVDNDGVRT